MITSRREEGERAYVYLQRPDNSEWVVVGRYELFRADSYGKFIYAPSYVDAGYPWAIDPINLQHLNKDVEYITIRYDGLSDVLRDVAPDGWGRELLQRAGQVRAEFAHEFDFLKASNNADRWGALAIGNRPKPNVTHINTPTLASLKELLTELDLLARQKPAANEELRERLFKAGSVGGARPKVTVQDRQTKEFWLAKPTTSRDTVDVAYLEFVTMRWAKTIGLNAADCEHRQIGNQSVFLVKRFDRHGKQRHMTLSAASILGAEHPAHAKTPVGNKERLSYSSLAENLLRIGVPFEDRIELFKRMIFNAMIGNDDDHPRNHAIIWVEVDQKWCLSPAFDIVPNSGYTPDELAMKLSRDDWLIAREAVLKNALSFGFKTVDEAEERLDATLNTIMETFYGMAAPLLEQRIPYMRDMLEKRLHENFARLSRT